MIFSKHWLSHEYITLDKSSEQIGREIGMTGRNVRYQLKKHGFQKEMIDKRRTVGIGKVPPNKGVYQTTKPKLGRRYIHIQGKAVPKYRHLLEQSIGRKLNRKEIIHHIDQNPLNDSLDNLMVMSQSEHMKLHHRLRKLKKY